MQVTKDGEENLLSATIFFLIWSGLLLVILRYVALEFGFSGVPPDAEALVLGGAAASLIMVVLYFLMVLLCPKTIQAKFSPLLLVCWIICMSMFSVTAVFAPRIFVAHHLIESFLTAITYEVLTVLGLFCVTYPRRSERS